MDKETVKSLPRDFFLHLFSTIALWIVATSFGTIIFQVINIYIPDVTMTEPMPVYARSHMRNLITWSMASLIVVFPVYILVMRFLNKDVREFSEKAELRIRKWLLYLTLFLAAVVLIGDLISLIYNFLQGELTLRFFLKIGTILIIAVSIFSYYHHILKGENLQRKSFIITTFPKIITGLTAMSIVAGFVAVGLPKSQRSELMDDIRARDLEFIQGQISDYWMTNKKLPDNLDDLKILEIVPADPRTNTPYDYEIVDRENLKYRICANFETSNRESARGMTRTPYFGPILLHDAKNTCFEKTVRHRHWETNSSD